MTSDSFTETYRGHKIVARLHEDSFKGRIYHDEQSIHDCIGTSIDEVKEVLRNFVDNRLEQIAEQRDVPPNGEEYVAAFHKILGQLNDKYCAMLKAHYHAKDQTITATKLAEAAGYPNYNSANLHYGRVGYILNEELPIKLPIREADGIPIATFALATEGMREGPEENWTWKLRPGVAYAIEKLGLHT